MNDYSLYKQAYEELRTKGKSRVTHEPTSEDSRYILNKYNYNSQEIRGKIAVELAINDVARGKDLKCYSDFQRGLLELLENRQKPPWNCANEGKDGICKPEVIKILEKLSRWEDKEYKKIQKDPEKEVEKLCSECKNFVKKENIDLP